MKDFKTKSKLEEYLVDNFEGNLAKANYVEDGYDVVTRMETKQKLVLYYLDEKHIATWNSTHKRGFLLEGRS